MQNLNKKLKLPKVIIILAFVLLYTAASAQVHIELGFGATHSTFTSYDDRKDEMEVTTVLPAFKLAVGYQFRNLIVEVSEQPTISAIPNHPNLLGAKAGYNINGLVPFVGYYWNLASSDNEKFNSWNIGYGLKYQYMIKENAGLFAEASYINKSTSITAGMHYEF